MAYLLQVTMEVIYQIAEIQNKIKSIHCYLDVHSNGEMNESMDDLKQFVDNMVMRKTL